MSAGWRALLVGARASALAPVLALHGGSTTPTDSVKNAAALLLEQSAEVIIADHDLSPERGIEMVRHLRDTDPTSSTVVIIIAERLSPEEHIDVLSAGADDVLVGAGPASVFAAVINRRLELKKRFDGVTAEAKALLSLSRTDGLTEVANHRAFQERLRDEFRRAQRYDVPLSLILVDVDHFKKLNDLRGHQFGDEALRAIAKTISTSVRETDFVARYGGEEFAVILPSTPMAGALTVAERACIDIRNVRLPADLSVQITASFGVSSFPARLVSSPEQLIKSADDALYRAKREGRNKIALHQTTFLNA